MYKLNVQYIYIYTLQVSMFTGSSHALYTMKFPIP